MLRCHFGLTPDEYAARLAAQGGVCAICGGAEPRGKRFAMDHEHRIPAEDRAGHGGLLCGACNTALGLFQDSPQLLGAAITHLAKYNVTP